MRAIIDTCIIIDFLQKREPFAEAAQQIMRAAAAEMFEGFVTTKSVTDIHYITHRATHDNEKTRNIVSTLLSVLGMIDVVPSDIIGALASDVSDFEDAVMAEVALRSRADCIVTRNGKDFSRARVQIRTPEEFLAEMGAEA